MNVKFIPKYVIEKKALKLIDEMDSSLLEKCIGIDPWEYLAFLQEKERLKDFRYVDMDSTILGMYRPIENEIYLNNKLNEDLKAMNSFTIAHEIGHFILHRNDFLAEVMQLDLGFENYKEKDIICKRQTIESDIEENDSLEWQANYFAASLLMPSKSLNNQFENYKRQNYPIIENNLCEIFHCSKKALKIRLKELGLYHMSQNAL